MEDSASEPTWNWHSTVFRIRRPEEPGRSAMIPATIVSRLQEEFATEPDGAMQGRKHASMMGRWAVYPRNVCQHIPFQSTYCGLQRMEWLNDAALKSMSSHLTPMILYHETVNTITIQDGECDMSFNVTFKILWSRSGSPIEGGILVYKCNNLNGRTLSPDKLDHNGMAKTTWHDSWSGDSVEVYCHTDGINSGKPKYIETVTLKRGASFVLWP